MGLSSCLLDALVPDINDTKCKEISIIKQGLWLQLFTLHLINSPSLIISVLWLCVSQYIYGTLWGLGYLLHCSRKAFIALSISDKSWSGLLKCVGEQETKLALYLPWLNGSYNALKGWWWFITEWVGQIIWPAFKETSLILIELK